MAALEDQLSPAAVAGLAFLLVAHLDVDAGAPAVAVNPMAAVQLHQAPVDAVHLLQQARVDAARPLAQVAAAMRS